MYVYGYKFADPSITSSFTTPATFGPTEKTKQSTSGGSSMSTEATAGIGVAVALFFVKFCVFAAFLNLWKRRRVTTTEYRRVHTWKEAPIQET